MTGVATESRDWLRCTRATRCPICQRPKFCTVSPDGAAVRCTKVESDRPSPGADGAAWIHALREPLRVLPAPPREHAAVDWRARHAQCVEALTPERTQELADALDVDSVALVELGLGYDVEANAWTMPMHGADGAIVGLQRRFGDGRKQTVQGGRMGLFKRVQPDDGALLLCEGASDTAAALSFGHDAIGVPSAGQGGDLLAGYVRGRDVVVVADADEAGARGAATIATAIRDVARSVRIVTPPGGAKDLREARVAGCKRADLDAAIAAATVIESARAKRMGRLLSLSDLRAMPAVRWVVRDLVPEGVTILFGDPNTGKTTMAAAWSRCVLHGQDWNGRKVRGGSVLFLAGESVKGVAARLEAWHRTHGRPADPPGRYLRVDPAAPPLSKPEGCAELAALVDDLTAELGHAPSLIVVDTVSAHWDESEDKTEFVAPALRALQQLAAKHGLAILLLHHPRKPGENVRGGGDLASLRGSSAWAANSDAVLLLAGNRDAMELRTPKLRDAGRDARIPLRLQTVDLEGVDEDGRPRSSVVVLPAAASLDPEASRRAEALDRQVAAESRVDAAVDALRQLGGSTTSKRAITDRMGGKWDLANAALLVAIDRDRIKVRKGARKDVWVYHLPESDGGREVPPKPPGARVHGGAPAPSSAPTAEGARGVHEGAGVHERRDLQ